MAYKRKTWREKLADSKDLPKVVAIEGKMAKRWGTSPGDTCAIPSPMEINEMMREVSRGKLITIHELRATVAKKHGATIGCPITTGIFTWISAHAAAEDLAEGKKRITPYWRTLKVGGEINPKFPGGLAAVAKLLRAEGHRIIHRGKRWFVEDFEKSLAWHGGKQ